MIYGDYLPVAALNTPDSTTYPDLQLGYTNSSTYPYSVGTTSYGDIYRIELLSYITTPSNFSNLLTNKISNLGAKIVSGSPTVDMYVASWNNMYPDDQIITAQNSNGYMFGLNSTPRESDSDYYYVKMSSKEGYSNTLYYPQTSIISNNYGYWLAGLGSYNSDSFCNVNYNGNVNGNNNTNNTNRRC